MFIVTYWTSGIKRWGKIGYCDIVYLAFEESSSGVDADTWHWDDREGWHRTAPERVGTSTNLLS